MRLDESAWAVFEQLPVAVAVADIRTGRFLRVNRGMAALTGYSVEELTESTVLDIAPPEERALIRAEFARLLRRESRRYTAERRYISKDGTPRWADVSVTLLANSSDEPQALAVLQDVTARHHIQLALARSKERFEIALSHAPVILFNHDLALRYTWIHNAVWRKPEAFIGLYGRRNLPAADGSAIDGVQTPGARNRPWGTRGNAALVWCHRRVLRHDCRAHPR